MKSIKLKHPAPGTILGLLALIVALAGNADAFSGRVIVRKGDIAKGAVTAKTLARGAVHARALAPGAVQAKALAAGSVTTAALKPGAVTAEGLAPNVVTSSAIAPGSIYGGALGPVAIHGAPIADLDVVPSNPEWTASSVVTATCSPGERLLSGGVVFTDPGNHEVGVLQALPFSNGPNSGLAGQITSNSGGTASAEVQAYCLK
jgi:hypothetical protein